MDLCAEKLLENFPPGKIVEASIPRFRRVLGWLPFKKTLNFDRWYNRWRVYPSHVKKLATRPGFFHIVDHSYSHLVNYLPKGKVGIYCHDLDAFRCLLKPEEEPRPYWFKKMMIRVFEGFKRARVLFCSTMVTRDNLLSLGFWKSDAIHVVPYGIAEEFNPDGARESGDYILHVGSCIPRKRIDLLLEIFAEVRKSKRNLKMIQAGGCFTREQAAKIKELNLVGFVEQRTGLTRNNLADLYRGAKLLLVTSDAEGFGLPVIEGLACGTPVIASDIPTLREAGGAVASYCKVGNLDQWVSSISKEFEKGLNPERFERAKAAIKKNNWSIFSKQIIDVYSRISN
jgi:glycosyltransferase involved in cell wall biosynthesis